MPTHRSDSYRYARRHNRYMLVSLGASDNEVPILVRSDRMAANVTTIIRNLTGPMSFQKMDHNAEDRALNASLLDERITCLPVYSCPFADDAQVVITREYGFDGWADGASLSLPRKSLCGPKSLHG